MSSHPFPEQVSCNISSFDGIFSKDLREVEQSTPYGMPLSMLWINAAFVLRIASSASFLLGSLLIHPALECIFTSCGFLGAVMFILGGALFFLDALLILLREQGNNRFSMFAPACAAGLFFVVGSVLFLPQLVRQSTSFTGEIVFGVGCVVIIFDTLQAYWRSRDEQTFRKNSQDITLIVGCGFYIIPCFIGWGLLYVYSYIIGSFFFLLSSALSK